MLIPGRIFYDLDILQEEIAKILIKYGVNEFNSFKVCCVENNESNYDILENILSKYGIIYVPKDSKKDDGFEHLFELETKLSDFTVTVAGIADRIYNYFLELYEIDDNVYDIKEWKNNSRSFRQDLRDVFQNTPYGIIMQINREVLVQEALDKKAKKIARKYYDRQKEIEAEHKHDDKSANTGISLEELFMKLNILGDKDKNCDKCIYYKNNKCDFSWELEDKKTIALENKGQNCVHYWRKNNIVNS